MKLIYKIYLIIFFLFSLSIHSQEIKFYGEAKAGSIVIGKGKNISSAFLNDKSLPVDNNGIFIFGFDRNANGKFILTLRLKNKKVLKYEYSIVKREYEEQSLTLQRKFITPPRKELKKIESEKNIIGKARSKIGKLKTALFSSGFVNPVDSVRITGNFGVQRILNGKRANIHNGVDFAGREGDPVYAITDGIVRLAEENFYYNGNFILIDHGQGLSSMYLHLSRIFVKNNQKVKKGELIGLMGSTGRSTAPHLHLEIKWFNKRIDPVSVLTIQQID